MLSFAKTNIQLFNQLLSDGYSKKDIEIIYNTYQFAQHLFPCHYRPSGDTFISHLVGTASILASLHLSVKLVAAGLLHAAYIHGDFGTIKIKPIPNTRRKQVRDIVGNEVEEYIFKYTTLKWNSQTIPIILDHLNTYSMIDRDVLLIRLVNELEDNLNLGPLYCPDADKRKQYIKNYGSLLVDIANNLGFPFLASEMIKVFKEIISTEISSGFYNRSGKNKSYLIAPMSYNKRLSYLLSHQIFIGARYLKKFLKKL